MEGIDFKLSVFFYFLFFLIFFFYKFVTKKELILNIIAYLRREIGLCIRYKNIQKKKLRDQLLGT